jgi:hypothetical protein
LTFEVVAKFSPGKPVFLSACIGVVVLNTISGALIFNTLAAAVVSVRSGRPPQAATPGSSAAHKTRAHSISAEQIRIGRRYAAYDFPEDGNPTAQ